jgi:hypothetical protein
MLCIGSQGTSTKAPGTRSAGVMVQDADPIVVIPILMFVLTKPTSRNVRWQAAIGRIMNTRP